LSENGAIRIGNQTASSAANFLKPYEYALANGFDAFEWFPDKKPNGAGWDESDLNAALCADIRGSARVAHMRLSLHVRWTANPLRSEARTTLIRDIELAESLGAVLVNVHLYPERGMEAYAKALRPFIRHAASRRLQLAIENTPETTPQHFNELFRVLEDGDSVARPTVGMCFDLGHANLCAATRNDYLRFLDQLEPHVPIIHLHVHENRGDADSHLPLFTGPAGQDSRGVAGFLARLQAKSYAGSLILEQWPEPPSLLNQARDRLLELLQAQTV